MAQTVLGFDIGSNRLRIAQMKDNKIKRFVSVLMPDNVVKSGHVVSYNALADIIKETLKTEKISGHQAAIALPQESYYIRRIQLPKMTISQLKVNLPFEFHEYIAGEPDEYYYDYAVISMDEDKMELMAAAILKSTMKDYQDMMKRAGCKLIKLVPNVLCTEAILQQCMPNIDEEKKDFAVLDIGHSATRLHFFAHGYYEITRTMETSARDLAQMISENRGMDVHISQLYIEHDQDNILDDGMCSDYLDQMATEIMRVMNFYGYNNPNNTIESVYYCGCGMKLDKLVSRVHELTDMPTKPLSELLPVDIGVENINDGPDAYGAVIE